MSAQSATLAGRRAAERLMTDTFAAYSPGGTTTNASGQEAPGFNSEGSTFGRVHGIGRIQSAPAHVITVGGVERTVIEGGLRIPVTAPAPAIGWEYQMTTAGSATDPGLIGRRWHVVGVQSDSFATARRLNVVDVTP